MTAKEKLWRVHEIYIRRTVLEAAIHQITIRVTTIAKTARRAMHCSKKKVYIHSRTLKHLYDKRPAEEFDFLIDHIASILRNPGYLFKNKEGKTGNFCIVKKMGKYHYIVILEIKNKQTQNEEIWIVTAFRLRNGNYIKNYDLLRSWRDDTHSS
jgi:hypothetical protein